MRTLGDVIKELNNRMMALESTVYNDSEGPIEKYSSFSDSIKSLKFIDDGLTYNLHQYKICSSSLACGLTQYI